MKLAAFVSHRCRLEFYISAVLAFPVLSISTQTILDTKARADEPQGITAESSQGGVVSSVDYLTEIKPLLAEKCYSCHGVLKQESGLRLDTVNFMLEGGSGGPIFTAGDTSNSAIIDRVLATDDTRMPPEGEGAQLKPREIELLRNWIQEGAVAPEEQPPTGPEDHWAFQVPRKTPLPTETTEGWDANPIDVLLAAGHRERGLVPVPQAHARTQLRRLFIDLIGLPPSTADLMAFEQNPSPEAYREIVDRLLNSPQYGERWGRHWMDVWRYSDWHGLGDQLRNSQKHIWQWRDWIIESLNQDLGYDRMIQDMLAADELAPEDLNRLRATGFLARQYYLFNRTTWMDDAIEHTSKAFLGLTMECAKCHSHKYDPIDHEDYYRFRAFFEPYQVRLDPVPGSTNLEQLALPRVFDAHPEAATYLHIRGNEKQPDHARVITPGVPAILGGRPLEIKSIALPVTAYQTSLRQYVIDDQLDEAKEEIQKATQELAQSQLHWQTLQDLQTRRESISQRDYSRSLRLISDDRFDTLNSDRWHIQSGDWQSKDGTLELAANDGTRKSVRSKLAPPENFEAVLEFTTTGGNLWKSVGLAFDVQADGRESMVYLSAVEPGSKVQIALNSGTGAVYPPEAALSRQVVIGQPQTLVVRVREQLVNVFHNGQVVLAYTLPNQREQGVLEIVAFDATAKVDRLLVRELKDDELMIEPAEGLANQPPMDIQLAEQQIDIVKKKLEMVRRFPTAFTKAVKAEQAKLQEPKPEDLEDLIEQAAAAFAAYELATAKWQLAIAKEGEERQKAEAELQRAQSAVDTPNHDYLVLRASLKSLEGPDETAESQHSPFPKESTGRRRALAMWIASNENPLTARVGINHIWLRHFGQPLVESVTDFGLRAAPPTQQKLLDWLAVEWMENQWSMKHIHRIIVTSRAYRSESSVIHADPTTIEADPENRYFWRRLPTRMESQVVRDSLLALSDKLDTTLGGPPLPANAGLENTRRSLYFRHSIEDHNEFISMFDDADSLRCYRRTESVVPQQALALANSREAMQASRDITKLLMRKSSSGDDRGFVVAAFEHVLSQSPSEEEIQLCLLALQELRMTTADLNSEQSRSRSYENLVLALLNHNDFITIR